MTQQIETEDQLIIRAQQALSSCNWEIGECASQWTEKYSRGRTDGDFGALIGLSGDQVYQRRRVWETFSDVYGDYPDLKWSHFYVALNWDDAADCLQWANEIEATVAEMKAWRRAQHGEDLSEPPAEQPPFEVLDQLSVATGMVRDPGGGNGEAREYGVGGGTTALAEEDEHSGTAASAARESNSDYAPFGKGARGPAPGEGAEEKDSPSSEQVLKRACSSLERVVAALTPGVIEDFHDLPLELQQRFVNAVDNLQSRTAGLS